MQPTINPLFKTRQFQDSLLKWSGSTTTYDQYFKNYWETKLGGTTNYEKALQDGVIEAPETTAGTLPFNGGTLEAAKGAVAGLKKSGTELVIYQKVSMADGKQSNNPWLLEVPDPITRASWDNYIMISPALAKELDLKIDLGSARSSD